MTTSTSCLDLRPFSLCCAKMFVLRTREHSLTVECVQRSKHSDAQGGYRYVDGKLKVGASFRKNGWEDGQ